MFVAYWDSFVPVTFFHISFTSFHWLASRRWLKGTCARQLAVWLNVLIGIYSWSPPMTSGLNIGILSMAANVSQMERLAISQSGLVAKNKPKQFLLKSLSSSSIPISSIVSEMKEWSIVYEKASSVLTHPLHGKHMHIPNRLVLSIHLSDETGCGKGDYLLNPHPRHL